MYCSSCGEVIELGDTISNDLCDACFHMMNGSSAVYDPDEIMIVDDIELEDSFD